MQNPRRLTAALAAAALAWTGLAFVATPAAQADSGNRDEPHDPATYYASADGLSGTTLATALNAIIDGNDFLPYTDGSTDVWDAMDVLDQDPNDASKVIDVYSGDSLVLTNKCGSSCALDGWNREHTWAQSRGSFDTDPGPGTDLFHMRVSRGNTNSSRGNHDFDETVNSGGPVPGCPTVCTRDGDSFEPRESIKGDVARGLFYMDVRYNGDADDGFGVDLRMWDQVGDSSSQLGKLSTLVAWSLADPPDDRERWRNDKIDSDYQGNRNPFIDHPEWVCSIWGSSVPPGTCNVPANQAPVATPQSVTTNEDTAKVVTLAGTDADGNPLTYAISTPPAHGAVSLAGNQATYTPVANYNGPDSFSFTVNDGTVTSLAAAVTITVDTVNDAPVATAQPVTALENTPQVIVLAGTDVDTDPLTYAIATTPTHGTVDLNGNQATYTPATNYAGPDSFTFTVNDGIVTSAPATVSITVSPVNDAPTVDAAALATTFGSPVTGTLATSDVDGDAVTIIAATTPTHGSVAYAGRSVTYSPTRAGSDAFVVTVTDGNGGIATAQVGVEVAKAAPMLKISGSTLKAGKPGTIKVKLTGVAGVAPGGKVKLKVGGQTVTVTLKKGVATFKIAELPDAGQLKVKAKYLGDGQYAAGSAKKTFTVK